MSDEPRPSSPSDHPEVDDAANSTSEAEPASPAAPETLVEDWATRYKYLLAEFENFRKRVEKDLENARQTSRNLLLKDLFPLLEAFEKARDSTGPLSASDPLRKGLDLIGREFTRLLHREGIEPVAQVGMKFDARIHEAVAETAASDAEPADMIVEIVQQGFRGNAGLLRPAKVVVARSKAPPGVVRPPSETMAESESTEESPG